MDSFNLICLLAELDQETEFQGLPITYGELVEINLMAYLIITSPEWDHFDVIP